MRKFLLLAALLTLTGVPASAAQAAPTPPAADRHQVDYPIGNVAPSFGEVTFKDGYALVTLTVTSGETEVSLDPATVTLSLDGWVIDDGTTRTTGSLGPGKSASFAIKAKIPDAGVAGKTYTLRASLGIAKRTGTTSATKTFQLPGIEVIRTSFKPVRSLGFRGLRYEAEVRYAGRPLAPKLCTTKVLRPTAVIQIETGTKKKPKRKQIASGSLAKGTLKPTAKTCRLGFEYFFERKYNGKVGYFTFKFRQSIAAFKGKRVTVEAVALPTKKNPTPGPGRKIT